MSDIINQNTEPLFIFDMPDDEVLSQTISVQGEKGERGDPTKTSQLINDSDYTTNAALNAGLATKANLTDYQATASQVATNTQNIAGILRGRIAFAANGGDGRYYKITTFEPSLLTSNDAILNIHGKIGGTYSAYLAHVDISIMNRRNGFKACGTFIASSRPEAKQVDIVAYEEDGGEYTLYLYVKLWASVNLDLAFYDLENQYNGTYTTLPSGTIAWSLSNDTPLVQRTIDGKVSADIDGDAATVNGHTVDIDVPAGAKFTDTIYDDSVVTENIDAANDAIADLNSRVASLTNSSPIPVSSISEMTDTTKIYVNTTDGNWYYYDGTAWVSGGAYQVAGIAANSVDKYMTTFRKHIGRNLFDWTTSTPVKLNIANNPIAANNNTYCVYIPIEPNRRYVITKTLSARFAAITTALEPAVGVNRITIVQDNSATKITIDAASNANYLCVFYYLSTADTLDELAIRKSIMICEDNYNSYNYDDYYALSIGKADINEAAVTPSRTTFAKETVNKFDDENITSLHAFFNTTNTTLIANSDMRTVVVPCEPNTAYTIVKPALSQRFAVGYVKSSPSIGTQVYGIQKSDNAHEFALITSDDATHIVIFLCSTTIMTLEDAVKGLMVVKGAAPDSYVPHKVIDIKTHNLEDGCVTKEKLAAGIFGNNSLSSRSKVYGISFDITDDDASVTRIADAQGLKTDYVVGSVYQLNDGVNDFDNIYPWSDMRLCNLKFANGKKVVTYAEESGFALDGSNGEVMVEIPKFYSMRQRIGNNETWAITGEKKAGFEIEPLFKVGGVEQDFAYVGAYNTTIGGNSFSHTGALPTVNTSLTSFISAYSAASLQSYDITCFLAIQKLMCIEFATRDLQKYLGGIVNHAYMRQTATVNPDGKIVSVDAPNTVTIAPADQNRIYYFYEGIYVKFGTVYGADTNLNGLHQITSITKDDNTGYLTIVYGGDDMSATIAPDTWGVYACAQPNGLTDSLPYHTGRTDFETTGTSASRKNLVNPFRYRYIENVWGNVWERICGIRLKNLNFYVSTEPNEYDITASWDKIDYNVPLQTQAGHVAAAWIVGYHYDREKPLIMLPDKVGSSNGGGDGKYFSDSFYSDNTNDYEYESVVGGAWDHYVFAGPFTLRSYIPKNNSGWLYGSRVIYRG